MEQFVTFMALQGLSDAFASFYLTLKIALLRLVLEGSRGICAASTPNTSCEQACHDMGL